MNMICVGGMYSKLNEYVERKYGEDKLPYYLSFGENNDSYNENISKFKEAFQIDDPKLRIYLWNCFFVRSEEIENIKENDFTREEYEFILARFKAREQRESLNIDDHPNLNAEIKSERIILRPPTEDDARLFRAHLKKDGDFETYTGMKLNRENLDIFSPFRSPYTFSILDKTSGRMIGLVGLYKYDDIRRMARIEWYLFKDFRGQGFMREAINSLADRALAGKLFEMRETIRYDVFKKHYARIDIIRAEVRVTNVASQKVALACGFEEQYVDRRHVVVNGNSFEDCIIYDLERKL